MSVRPVQTTELTGDGQIKASAGTLIWLIAANSSGSKNRYLTLNNATSGSGSEVCRIDVRYGDTKFFAFPPGFYFSTGIRVGTAPDDLIITGAYE